MYNAGTAKKEKKENLTTSFITFNKGGMIMYFKGRFNKKATQTLNTSYCIPCCIVKKTMGQISGEKKRKSRCQETFDCAETRKHVE